MSGKQPQRLVGGKGPAQLPGQVTNRSGGNSWVICDMERLRRFLVLGSELNTYYATAAQLSIENIQCVQRLLDAGHYREVLACIEEYSKSGRVAKEDPILLVLALCAVHINPDVRKAAYEKVNSICNIPTKLFRFIDLTHQQIVKNRISNPPDPQPLGRKRKLIHEQVRDMNLDDQPGPSSEAAPSEQGPSEVGPSEVGPCEVGPSDICVEEKPKEPVESVDETTAPPSKKKKKAAKEPSKFKKVNKADRKSLGWGRMRRNGIGKFYKDDKKDACRLLYLCTKYKQRNNWNHKQVLGYTHPKISDEKKESKDLVLKYCTRGYKCIEKDLEKLMRKPGISEDMSEVIAYIHVINEISNLDPSKEGDEDKLLDHMTRYGVRSEKKEFTTLDYGQMETEENMDSKKSPIQVVREHIPTGFLNSKRVWEALLLDMPMTAMLRNLGKMTSMKLFDDNPDNVNFKKNVKIVTDAFKDVKRLQNARIHPLKILVALQVYSVGKGDKGSLVWQPNGDIQKALDKAFYKSFHGDAAKSFKTGKKHLLGLDVSSSMNFQGGCVGCTSLTPAMAATAMAMVTWNIEGDVEIMAFGEHFEDMKHLLKKNMTILDAIKKGASINFGCTDCSLPMVYALEKRMEVDVFIVYTDNETNFGRVAPMTALRNYNKEMEREAKLIVCGLQGNKFSIADPNDNIAMDVVGFDANVPELINNFIKGDKDLRCDVCADCKQRREPGMEQ